MTEDSDQSKSRFFVLDRGTIKLVISAQREAGQVLHSPGSIVDKKYKILELIGEGGMGAVYRAHHLLLNKDVALKTFRSSKLSHEKLIRFQREAQAIGKLSNKHIVQIYDFGQSEEGLPYYIMELLSGQTLANNLAKNGPMKTAKALPLFEQICQGLAVAHNKGIIHRDLKPANICIETINKSTGSDINIRIVDFGIASLSATADGQKLTTSGEVFGSPLYMSPEQSLGQEITAKSDIYSLGCALYETLVGEPPFRGATAIDTIMQHHNKKPMSLVEATDGKYFSDQLEDLVSQMLAKNPADRPDNIREVEARLFDTGKNKKGSGAAYSSDKTDQSGTFSEISFENSSEKPSKNQKKKRRTFWTIVSAAASIMAISAAAMTFSGIIPTKVKITKDSAQDQKSDQTENSDDLQKIRVAAFKANRNNVEMQGGEPYHVLKLEPTLNLGLFESPAISPEPFAVTGSIKWKVNGPITFTPSKKFWANMDNFEAIPDNSLFALDCENAPKETDMLALMAFLKRQSTTIQSLSFGQLSLEQAEFKTLSTIDYLHQLTFSDSNIDVAEITRLPRLMKYDEFGLTGCKNASILLPAIKGSQWLKTLALGNTGLTRKDINILTTFSNLQTLDVNNNKNITEEDLALLANLTRLTELKIYGCPIGPAALPSFARMKKNGLTSISLTPLNWPDSAIEQLRTIFPDADLRQGIYGLKKNDSMNEFKDFVNQPGQ